MTNALLDPNNFEWAKSLLESKAWGMIIQDNPSATNITFAIPKSCPSKEPIRCSTISSDAAEFIESKNEDTPEKQAVLAKTLATSSTVLKRKLGKAPMISSEVRRSERIKTINQRFKPMSCLSKNCFCYSTEAPTLTAKVIRILGADFCKIPISKLSDDRLKKKNVPKRPTGSGSKQDNPKNKNQGKNVSSPNKKPKKK
jgi:hypothetical protein